MLKATSGNLLIVDDEPSVRNALARLFRKEGYVIHAAGSAADADRILDENSIDVIICDQDMPGRTGTEFLKEAARKFPNQRRLMISGRFQSTDVANAMDIGAVHKFMMKPWNDAILKADVRASFRQIIKEYSNDTSWSSSTDSSHEVSNIEHEQSWLEFEEDRKLSRELHSAPNNGSLSLVYQPQIRLQDNTISGFEALLRWNSTAGPIPPDRFIALAERGGSMSKISHWVFRETCLRTKQWLNRWNDGQISLNVSPVDFRDDSLIHFAESMIEHYAIPAGALHVEVTESQALKCDDTMKARLTALSDLGLELAIDDFGAGATALSYLAELPFSILKLDRSLTLQLDYPKGQTVVQKVLEMAHSLGMKTIIEGIETEAQADLARTLGAEIAQGYFYSKPRSQDDVLNWIDSGCSGIL